MQDIIVFLFTQLSNLILFFDSITIIGSLTLLRLFIIVIMFSIIIKFLGGRKSD